MISFCLFGFAYCLCMEFYCKVASFYGFLLCVSIIIVSGAGQGLYMSVHLLMITCK